MLDTILYLVPALAIVGLIYMFVQARWVRAQSAGEPRMIAIMRGSPALCARTQRAWTNM